MTSLKQIDDDYLSVLKEIANSGRKEAETPQRRSREQSLQENKRLPRPLTSKPHNSAVVNVRDMLNNRRSTIQQNAKGLASTQTHGQLMTAALRDAFKTGTPEKSMHNYQSQVHFSQRKDNEAAAYLSDEPRTLTKQKSHDPGSGNTFATRRISNMDIQNSMSRGKSHA